MQGCDVKGSSLLVTLKAHDARLTCRSLSRTRKQQSQLHGSSPSALKDLHTLDFQLPHRPLHDLCEVGFWWPQPTSLPGSLLLPKVAPLSHPSSKPVKGVTSQPPKLKPKLWPVPKSSCSLTSPRGFHTHSAAHCLWPPDPRNTHPVLLSHFLSPPQSVLHRVLQEAPHPARSPGAWLCTLMPWVPCASLSAPRQQCIFLNALWATSYPLWLHLTINMADALNCLLGTIQFWEKSMKGIRSVCSIVPSHPWLPSALLARKVPFGSLSPTLTTQPPSPPHPPAQPSRAWGAL